jgi:two-component system cell cycle sensor histidine kinase/response regulator CckA
VIGKVAESRRSVAQTKAKPDPAIAMSSSVLASPLIAEGNLVGVLQVGTVVKRDFGDDELRLLQLVADRAAVAIEGTRLERAAVRSRLAAEGAKLRLEMLAEAGGVLARSFDDARSMLDGVATALVPRFVDWFAFHEAGERSSPVVIETAATGVDAPGADAWQRQVPTLLDERQQHLVWGRALEDERWEWALERRLTSVVSVPVEASDGLLGVLLLGTTGTRRGLRPGDLTTAVDLATRIGVTLERVQLVIQTQQSAIRAARHATQLQRLAEATSAVNAALDTDALAAVVAEQAARVLETEGAWVELGDREVASHGERPPRARNAKHDLTDANGQLVGQLGVARRSPVFNADEQAVMGSLAQTVSVALANARLYETVQDSEERLRALYDASPVGIVELAPDGAVARWNRAAESIFGWPAYSERAAKSVRAPIDARDVVSRAVAGERPDAIDVDLGNVHAEIVAVPLPGHPGGAVLVAVDVTERKHVAEQLQQAQRMEAMARMAGGIAHDFNNVLMVIIGYADLALRRRLSGPVREDVEGMRNAAGRAAELTRSLLTIGRRQLVAPEVVDLGTTLGAIDGMLPVMLGDAITLKLEIDAPPRVLIDPAHLEQVVLNLAINARDAMPDGGELLVRARSVKRNKADWAELVVSDTGTGMTPEQIEHCFEPFYSTKHRTKGSGLGLSTVYGVVTTANGEISVDSAPGKGSTFTILLPAAPASIEAVVSPAVEKLGSLRVLVVDDEPDLRAIVADMLELEGHEVTVAADAREALELVAQTAPDVLLSDVVMPGMRGTELVRTVVAAHPGVRAILMSSHVDDELGQELAAAGIPFLAKPFSPQLLVSAVAGGEPKRKKRTATKRAPAATARRPR